MGAARVAESANRNPGSGMDRAFDTPPGASYEWSAVDRAHIAVGEILAGKAVPPA